MILLQPDIDTRPVKIDWYWSERRPSADDGLLREVNPFYVITESIVGSIHEWEVREW